jgi:hypothetical protein
MTTTVEALSTLGVRSEIVAEATARLGDTQIRQLLQHGLRPATPDDFDLCPDVPEDPSTPGFAERKALADLGIRRAQRDFIMNGTLLSRRHRIEQLLTRAAVTPSPAIVEHALSELTQAAEDYRLADERLKGVVRLAHAAGIPTTTIHERTGVARTTISRWLVGDWRE